MRRFAEEFHRAGFGQSLQLQQNIRIIKFKLLNRCTGNAERQTESVAITASHAVEKIDGGQIKVPYNSVLAVNDYCVVDRKNW